MDIKFCYGDLPFDVGKYAYDMSMLYAKIKTEQAFKEGYFFDGPAPVEVEQIEYLQKQFFFAYDYLSGHDPGDFERLLEFMRKKSAPDMP